jgi:SpoIID/LytB domain protein
LKKLLFFFIAIMVFVGVMPGKKEAAEVEPQVQVKLVNFLGNQSSVALKLAGSFYLNDSIVSNKNYTVKVENGAISFYDGTVKIASGSDVKITPVNNIDHVFINNREYAGGFDFTVENNFVRPVNMINLEDYLKSVVPAEMPGSWALEALKAQAVSARTYAYFRLNRSVINDTTSNQVYRGIESLYSKSTDAVNATAGKILTYNGTAIDAAFSSSNGGMTESQFNTPYNTTMPYFGISADPFDTAYRNWSVTLQKQQINTTGLDLKHPENWWNTVTEQNADYAANMKSWLSRNGYANKDIKIVSIPTLNFSSQTDSGRYFRGNLTIQFFVKDQFDANGELQLQTKEITNELTDNIRYIISSKVLTSNLFSVTETQDAYNFVGSGNGHGVGLSQYGAKGRAEANQTYNQILSFYYPGTVLTSQYTPIDQTKLKSGWISWGNKWYFFDAKGIMKTGWVSSGGKWYFMDTNGVMKTGWIYTGGRWYFLDTNGVMKTGWVSSGGKWYFMDTTSGAMKTGWLYSGSKWYYLDGSGAMKTGWAYISSKWYYLDTTSGAMKTGWVKIGGYWYYFYSNGSMAANTTIQGHRINSSGVMVS